ncbi:MAG: hypothetical protein SPK22_07390 [Alloprevotella sp.]|nr:hypothetical protein [Bacteroidales bacterium]MDY5770013.1 hypothetical protein [Alloprevotella sp.]
MKKKVLSKMARLLTCLFLLFTTGLPAAAQQTQQLKRSKTVFVFPEFQDAKIKQSFGRFAKAKANIFLKDGSLCYMDGDKVMKAYTEGIFGVVFNDTIEYMKVDSAMARVVARKDYNTLLRLTTVDMARYREETEGGANLPFFEISEMRLFLHTDSETTDEDTGLPLQDKYFFNVRGTVIPANESSFKKILKPEQRQPFKVLMQNHFWSWKDEESLKMLLDFLP